MGSYPTGRELIFPSFFPSYLSSSPSDLHTPPFFQSTRCEIGSETTDNLSEDNPVKNADRASAHALILTHGEQHTWIVISAIQVVWHVAYSLRVGFRS